MTIPGLENPPTKNKKLLEWVEEAAELTQPDRVVWCDGSRCRVEPTDRRRWSSRAPSSVSTPRSAPTRSSRVRNPSDVARVEDRTFICSLR
ncbi:MAG: hypothetical protein V9E98_08015 [Candidatus Nanopelagicales bacterium]